MSTSSAYSAVLDASAKATWRLEDVIGPDKSLDFGRPFLPETLARTEALTGLSAAERLALNHVRAGGYLRMFGLVEEFILPFVVAHAQQAPVADMERTRALLGFAAEEAKHIQVFRAFTEDFERGFGTPCGFIGPAEAIAAAILKHEPLSVALAILHIEWMTQRHYTDSVRDEQDLDPQFKSLLRHHWMEEAQHARLDALMVEALAASCDEQALTRGLAGYLAIGGFLDEGLRAQAALDVESLQAATRRTLRAAEKAEIQRVQHQALRWTFLGSGMTHPKFLAMLESLRPSFRAQVEDVASVFC